MIHLIGLLLIGTLRTSYAQDAAPPTDPRVLQQEDIEKLSETATGLLASCKDVKAKKNVVIKDLANKTDEHVNKKKFIGIFEEQLKAGHIGVDPKKGHDLALKLELSVTRNQTGNLYRGTYLLTVNVLLNGEANCSVSSKFEKTGQIEDPKKPE